MRTMKTGLCVVAVVGFAWGAFGCIPQLVTDLFTAEMKVAQGQFAQLTANEVLALNQAMTAALGSGPTLTSEQAQAVVDFLVANGLNTPADLSEFAQAVEDDPGSLQGLNDLAAAFEGTNLEFDAGNPTTEDIQDVLAAVFGGVT